MCLAVPGQILNTTTIGGQRVGQVRFGGVIRQAFLDFVPEAEVGDFVMVHVGFAISRVDAEEAARAYQLLETLGMLEEEGLGSAASPPAAEDASGGGGT